MLQAFRLNLEALSLLALFVGVFLIYNTAGQVLARLSALKMPLP
jgi:hypothetical protein